MANKLQHQKKRPKKEAIKACMPDTTARKAEIRALYDMQNEVPEDVQFIAQKGYVGTNLAILGYTMLALFLVVHVAMTFVGPDTAPEVPLQAHLTMLAMEIMCFLPIPFDRRRRRNFKREDQR